MTNPRPASSKRPSPWPRCPFKSTMSARRVAPIIHGTSPLSTVPANGSGRIMAVMPSTMPMLQVFEPMALPMASCGVPLSEASSATRISGAEVPTETAVTPMTIFDTPRFRAVAAAPDTNRSAPQTRAMKPMISVRMASHMGVRRQTKCPKGKNGKDCNLPACRQTPLPPGLLCQSESLKASSCARSPMGKRSLPQGLPSRTALPQVRSAATAGERPPVCRGWWRHSGTPSPLPQSVHGFPRGGRLERTNAQGSRLRARKSRRPAAWPEPAGRGVRSSGRELRGDARGGPVRRAGAAGWMAVR